MLVEIGEHDILSLECRAKLVVAFVRGLQTCNPFDCHVGVFSKEAFDAAAETFTQMYKLSLPAIDKEPNFTLAIMIINTQKAPRNALERMATQLLSVLETEAEDEMFATESKKGQMINVMIMFSEFFGPAFKL
eukprot:1571791-Amphidinium_carterae.1